MNKNFTYLLLISLIVVFFIISLSYNIFWLSISLIISVLVLNVHYSLKKVNTRIVFLIFQFTFFIFFLGRITVQSYFDFTLSEYIDFNFSNFEVVRHVLISIFLSIIFVSLGFRATKIQSGTSVVEGYYTTIYVRKIRRIALRIMYFASIIQIALIVEKSLFVQSFSYLEFYTDYDSSIPVILRRFGSLYELMFFVFLATMPLKKQCRVPLILYFLIGVGSLGFGQRNGFVLNTIFILIYMNLRNFYIPDADIWFNKKYYIFIVIAIPIVMGFLVLYSYYRSENAVSINILDLPKLFLYTQGNSANIIAYSYQFEPKIPELKFYSFGTLISFFKDSYIFDFFDIFKSYPKFSIDIAMEGHSFSMLISYLKLGETYLMGAGLGSSYIAELENDFGYIGIILGSLFYGFLMAKFLVFVRKSIWGATFAFVFTIGILYAPRAEFLGFISQFLSTTNLACLILIHIVASPKIKI